MEMPTIETFGSLTHSGFPCAAFAKCYGASRLPPFLLLLLIIPLLPLLLPPPSLDRTPNLPINEREDGHAILAVWICEEGLFVNTGSQADPGTRYARITGPPATGTVKPSRSQN